MYRINLVFLILFCTFAFAQSTTSPNMSLPVSIIGVTSGINWENNLNAALGIIDQHNHTPGQGVQIPPAGLNINTSLPFNNNSATNLQACVFNPQTSYTTDYGVHVEGVDLYYVDGNGNDIQITSGGTVNATSSGISSGTASASFSAGVLNVKSSSTSFANTAVQSILLANSGNLTNQLTLAAGTLSGSITETLPGAYPGSQSFLAMDGSGNITNYAAVSGGLTHSNLSSSANITGSQLSSSANITGSQLSSSAGITPAQLSISSSNYGVSSSSGNYSNTTGSYQNVTNLTNIGPASVTTTRPVFIMFSGTSSVGYLEAESGYNGFYQVVRGDGTVITSTEILGSSGFHPPGQLNCIDLTPNASYPTYTLQAKVSSGGASVTVANVIMTVVQL